MLSLATVGEVEHRVAGFASEANVHLLGAGDAFVVRAPPGHPMDGHGFADAGTPRPG